MKKAIAIFVVCCFVAAFADNPHITMLRELIDVALTSPVDGDVLTFNASAGKWENKANAQPVFPDTAKVIFRYQQEHVVGVFPETNLFTPEETGLYRINIYASLPLGGQGAVIVSATDDSGVQNQTFARFTSGGFGGVWAEQSGIIRAVSGSAVTITAASGGGNTAPYSFYVVVQKL